MSRQMRGLGRVFKRRGSRFFWLEYFHAGRRFGESSESESEQVATKLLKKRLAETGQGKVVGPKEEKVRFEDLADAVLNEYRLKGYRSLEAAEIHIRKLRSFFGGNDKGQRSCPQGRPRYRYHAGPHTGVHACQANRGCLQRDDQSGNFCPTARVQFDGQGRTAQPGSVHSET